MALSNVFREPRREVTETLVGAGVAGAFLCPGLLLAMLGAPIMLAALTLLGAIGVAAAIICIHELGEAGCDALARGGVELRGPRKQGRRHDCRPANTSTSAAVAAAPASSRSRASS